jgi:predicted  nucleic acid-binding Zn-ribbon protein
MKNWKSLFIKGDDTTMDKPEQNSSVYNFPTENISLENSTTVEAANTTSIDRSVLSEVVAVYEKGIDSINMPGYDFYEFYKAISSISEAGEQSYNMAFTMAKSMDNSVSGQKLLTDAEFYISKINEVHSQYTMQGQQKLNALETKKNESKNKLTHEIDQCVSQINNLRNQLQVLESDLNQKRIKLSAIDSTYFPQETAIRQKLLANDSAKQISVSKLLSVKDNIQKFIK